MNKFYRICKNILLENDQFEQDKKVAATVMDDPTPEHMAHLSRLSDHPNFDIKKAVGANLNTPPSVLHKMALNPKVDVLTRAEIAKNPSINAETFKWFLNNDVHLDHILSNPGVPLLHLEDPDLFNDVNSSAVASKMININPNYAQFLLNSKNSDVRQATLMHPDLPKHIMQSYYDQKSGSRKEENSLDNKKKSRRQHHSHYVTPLVNNPSTPDHILSDMLDTYDDLTNNAKSAIYNHANLSQASLDKEINKDPGNLGFIIENPKASKYENKILSPEVPYRVKEHYIYYNPTMTPEKLVQLGNHPNDDVANIARGHYNHPDNYGDE